MESDGMSRSRSSSVFKRRIAFVIFPLALVGVVTQARANDDKARIRELFIEATRSYNLADYEQALATFREGYRLGGQPELLFDIAQCYRQLGEAAKAAQAYRSFLRNVPDAPNRKDVERLIGDMERVARDEEAKKPPIGIELPRPAAVPDARRVEDERAVTAIASPDTTRDVGLTAATSPAEAPASVARRPLYKSWWLWTAVGAVVVAGAITAVAIAATASRDAAFPANDGAATVRF